MRKLLVSAITLALAGVSLAGMAAPADPAPAAALTTTQLPRAVRPTHYDVAVVPHAASLSFDGKVSVAIEVLEPTSSMTLHAIDMSFSSVQLTGPKGAPAFAAPKVSVDDKAQTVTFTFDRPIPKGSYTLAMAYTGKIDTQANGRAGQGRGRVPGRQAARAIHPVRELRRAPFHPFVGRASVQGHVRPGSHRALGSDGGEQYAGGLEDRPWQRPHTCAFPAVAEDVHLSVVLRHG